MNIYVRGLTSGEQYSAPVELKRFIHGCKCLYHMCFVGTLRREPAVVVVLQPLCRHRFFRIFVNKRHNSVQVLLVRGRVLTEMRYYINAVEVVLLSQAYVHVRYII